VISALGFGRLSKPIMILHHVSLSNMNAGTGQLLRLDLVLRRRISRLTALHTSFELLAASVLAMPLRLAIRNPLSIGLLKGVHILVNI